jgi:hypothetical protein
VGVVGTTASVTGRIIGTTTLTDVTSRIVGTTASVTGRIVRTTTLTDVAGRIIGTTAAVADGVFGLHVVGAMLGETEHRRGAGDADGAGTGQHCGEGDAGNLDAELRGLLH